MSFHIDFCSCGRRISSAQSVNRMQHENKTVLNSKSGVTPPTADTDSDHATKSFNMFDVGVLPHGHVNSRVEVPSSVSQVCPPQ